MKIGIVSPTYYPYPGGVPEHVYHTYLELRSLGNDVRVVTTDFGPGTAPNEHDVIRIGRSVPVPANGSICPVAMGIGMRGQVRRMLARERFDVIHLHEPLMPALCLSVVAEANAPTVGTFHANNAGALGYRAFRGMLGPYFDKVDRKIAVSHEARRTVQQHFGGEYEIIPNGVDIKRFSEAEPLEELVDGTFNVLFVGRMEPRKGAKYLFRSLRRIADEVPDFRLIVVGGGPLSRYYRSFVPSGLAERVVFAGRVSGEMLARYYATADVFCSPATGGESFGIVLIEAMAAGAAVVASDIPGYRDVVNHGTNGLLMKAASPSAIADTIISLAHRDELRRSLVETARADVRQYSWDRVTARILAVYEKAVSDGCAADSADAEDPEGDASEAEIEIAV